MSDPPVERMKVRAAAIAAGVRRARERRGKSLRAVARRSGVSPSTLSRLENPALVESPQVDTLEALALALDCPLSELLGEPAVIEYAGIGEWPTALSELLASRGGYITLTERAYLAAVLSQVSPDDELAAGSTTFWERLLDAYRDSPLWRTIEALVEEGWRLGGGAQSGLKLIVMSLLEGARAEWPDKLRTLDYGLAGAKADAHTGEDTDG